MIKELSHNSNSDPQSIRGRLEEALSGQPMPWPVYAVYDWFVINRNIDSGNIITQGIPKITKNDNSHTIGIKVAKVGSKLVIKVIDKTYSCNYVN